jgi:hypothetical protein
LAVVRFALVMKAAKMITITAAVMPANLIFLRVGFRFLSLLKSERFFIAPPT